MLRKMLIPMMAVLGLCTTAFGQVTLEHKFVEGASYTTEASVKTDQKLTIAGMNVDTAADGRVTTKSTVGKRDVEGKLRVEQKVEAFRTSIDLMGANYTFDSATPDDKGASPLEMLRDVHKAIAKRMTTAVYDRSNKVIAIESDQTILSSVPEQAQTLVKSLLDSESLKNAANDEIDQLKREPVKPGDTWKRTKSSNLGAGQVMTFDNEFTYVGTVEKDGRTLDKITTKTLAVSLAFENSPLPITLKDSALKVPESEGLILFDRAKGHVVETSDTTRITGDLTFNANNMDLPATLDLKMQTTTVVKP